ncbi:GIY-YIG nuclease family protein [Vibrio harveyi]|uniref:GIY-YIG nuclease family protein n=1 Tax=Vibrio harveyi TaxID=669 RepID=UPI002ED32B26|nr:GIY-YIG nuclease family protein [Vibrio harveyi]
MSRWYSSIHFTDENDLEIAALFDYTESTPEELALADKKYREYLKNDNAPRYLYIIRCGRSKYYKIGVTNDLEKRLATHQTGCPYELKIVCYFEADLSDFLGKEIAYLESFLHNNYAKLHVRGEWFELNYGHLSDIAMFLEMNRELAFRVCSQSEFGCYYMRQNRWGDEE